MVQASKESATYDGTYPFVFDTALRVGNAAIAYASGGGNCFGAVAPVPDGPTNFEAVVKIVKTEGHDADKTMRTLRIMTLGGFTRFVLDVQYDRAHSQHILEGRNPADLAITPAELAAWDIGIKEGDFDGPARVDEFLKQKRGKNIWRLMEMVIRTPIQPPVPSYRHYKYKE